MEQLVTERQVIEILSCSRSWILKNRRGEGRKGTAVIPYVRLGGGIRYRPADLDEWVKQNRVETATVD